MKKSPCPLPAEPESPAAPLLVRISPAHSSREIVIQDTPWTVREWTGPEQLLLAMETPCAINPPLFDPTLHARRAAELRNGPLSQVTLYVDRQCHWTEHALWQLLETEEREHSRLSQSLHEGLGQELAGIALLCKVLASRLQLEDHPQSEAANHIVSMMSQTVASTRDLAKGFFPIELATGGLVTALEALALRISGQFGLKCEFRHRGVEPRLEDGAEVHLYRIVQESVNNAIKHGRARHILIECRSTSGMQIISVTDNGIGFAKSCSDSTGLGLHLIGFRARIIGAKLVVKKPASSGCKITCKLPRQLLKYEV